MVVVSAIPLMLARAYGFWHTPKVPAGYGRNVIPLAPTGDSRAWNVTMS